MKIVAYTYFKSPESYETDVHCIDCHVKWARTESLRRGGNGTVRISANDVVEMAVTYFNGTVHDYAVAGSPVWEFPPERGPLVCADCQRIVST